MSKILLFILLSFPFCVYAQNFQWVDLNLGDECIDNSNYHNEILDYLSANTSITVDKVKKEIKISDDDLFKYPFITLSCKSALRTLSFAEILKLPLGTVKARIFRARELLKKKLRPGG